MKRQNVRTLSLIVVTFTYLLLGAAIFDAFESKFEVEEDLRLKRIATNLKQKYNMSQDDFDHITQLGIQMKPYKAGTQWKFAGAFYFATTVITTIGYGHSTPKTTYGKIFCMCYAVPGIPLCLVMFQSIGERMNTIITWLLKQTKKLCSSKCRTVSQTNLMLVSFTTGASVLTLGAAVFSRYEDWSYLDAFYYCFITLTTIGFGDFVALQRNDSLARRPDYVAFSLIFILFGLTVVSSVMNLLVLRFLTMNTEDERRDQLEAAAQAQELRRLRGDVIWTEQKMPTCNHPVDFAIHAVKPAYETYEVDSYSLRPQFHRNIQRFFNGLSTFLTHPIGHAVRRSRSSMLERQPSHSKSMDSAIQNVHRSTNVLPYCPGVQDHRPHVLYRALSLPEPFFNDDRIIYLPRYSEVVQRSDAFPHQNFPYLVHRHPILLDPRIRQPGCLNQLQWATGDVEASIPLSSNGVPISTMDQLLANNPTILECPPEGIIHQHHTGHIDNKPLWLRRTIALQAGIPEQQCEHVSRIDQYLKQPSAHRFDHRFWSEPMSDPSGSSCHLESDGRDELIELEDENMEQGRKRLSL